ncbi:unnamed protein product, partial [Soboliphyme baturini]|uniref:Endo/exonuclease/phosphatase domain-containing protein n=1 Tax=Soboliphyme baturini TaxID=241478 RepID=A0A183J8Z7_9BILA
KGTVLDDQQDICYNSKLSKVEFRNSGSLKESSSPYPVAPVRRRSKKVHESAEVTRCALAPTSAAAGASSSTTQSLAASMCSKTQQSQAANRTASLLGHLHLERLVTFDRKMVLFCVLPYVTLYGLLPSFVCGLLWGLFVGYVACCVLFHFFNIADKSDISFSGTEAAPFSSIISAGSVSRSWMSLCGSNNSCVAGVVILVEPILVDRIIHWKPVNGWMAIVRLKLQQVKALTLVQVYALNLERDYHAVLDEVQCALFDVPNTESLILMDDFNAHVSVRR